TTLWPWALGFLRFEPDGRLRRPRAIRYLADVSRLWRRVVPYRSGRRLGAVSGGALGFNAGLGLDLGRLRPVGVCAVPLRPMGERRRSLGMVSGRLRPAACMGARVGRLVRRQKLGRIGGGRWAGLRLGATRLARPLHSVMAQL